MGMVLLALYEVAGLSDLPSPRLWSASATSSTLGRLKVLPAGGRGRKPRPGAYAENGNTLGSPGSVSEEQAGVAKTWLTQAKEAAYETMMSTTEGASSAVAEAFAYASNITISAGLVQLPSLSSLRGTTSPAASSSANSTASTLSGFAWSAQAAMGKLATLPAYLKAVAVYQPHRTEEELEALRDGDPDSIFNARHKGQWMGCTQQFYVICKGAYRSLKRTNALTVHDVNCKANIYWLPLVIRHLKTEFRVVKLLCTTPDSSQLDQIKDAYEGVDHVTFGRFDPFTDKFVNQTDVVVAVKLLEHETMVRAMKLFRNLRESLKVGHIVMDSYMNSVNRPEFKDPKGGTQVHINLFQPPFMFGKPLYRYSNADEDFGNERIEVVAVKRDDLFGRQQNVRFGDLQDPKQRQRAKSKPVR